MKVNTPDLLNVILQLKNSQPTRVELNFLIEKSYKISLSFLKAKIKAAHYQFKTNYDAIEDIAMDSIVPLFVKNNEDKLGIVKSLSKWQDPIECSTDVEYFLSRIIWRRVDQTVTRVIKERDPMFDKILKTLNLCISENNFNKVRYFGTVYILPSSQNRITGNIINIENFNDIPLNIFGNKQASLFRTLFEYLTENTDFVPAIPFNLLIKRVKLFYVEKEAGSQQYTSGYDEELSVKEIVEEGLNLVKNKLEDYYIPNNKLTENDGKIILDTFNIISKDMMNGGMQDGLYAYLKAYKPDLTSEEFYSEYHSIMNYLFSNFKNNLINNLHVE